MYFSSINNSEVKEFHKVIPYNFNLSLTDILSSDLFYIETIVPDSVFRIYLLFYCHKITSSNPEDIIMENKCIVCSKSDTETYFNFISDDNDNFILNKLNGFYTFGDVLSNEDYNAIVQLLRVNNSFNENIQIKNSTVLGKYGTYVFNLKSTTIVDNGVLITNETLSSIGTVKLINPTFKNSNYCLKLTVYSLSDVNVCNESSNDNITETELLVYLDNDSEVNIPFNTLDLNCIVGFNAIIDITHDLPVIQYPKNIILSCDKSSCIVGDNITLTARVESDTQFSNETITFKSNGTELGTAITNANGIATFSYNPVISGDMNIIASNSSNKIISDAIIVKVGKKPSSISLNVNKNTFNIGEELIITGILSSGDELLSDCSVEILDGNLNLYSVTTDENGRYSKRIIVNDSFNYNLIAIFVGNSVYSDSESNYVNVMLKKDTRISIENYTPAPVYATETIYTIEGQLLDEDNNPVVNKTLVCKYNDSANSFNLITDNNGRFYDSRILSANSSNLRIDFNGDDYYNASNTIHNFSVVKHDCEFKDVIIKANTISGYLIQSGTNNPIRRAIIDVQYDNNMVSRCSTNSEGYFTNSIVQGTQSYSPRIWNSLSNSETAYNYSCSLDLTNFSVLRTSKIVDLGSVYENSVFNYKGRLVDDLNNPISNATVHLTSEYFQSDVRNVITNNNGEFSVTFARNDGFDCVYDGDNGIEGCNGKLR